MARVSPVPPEQYEPLFGADAPLNMRIHAQRPDLAVSFAEFAGKVIGGGELSPRLIELVRLRIAFHNQCRSCMAIRYSSGADAGVDEGLVCSLERPADADDLTEQEQVALRYADMLAMNHLVISDETYDELRTVFTEPQVVELGFVCALCVGFGRLESTWDMVDELPPSFAERDHVITPWGQRELIRA